jgi:PAS domain S-box-containing protein
MNTDTSPTNPQTRVIASPPIALLVILLFALFASMIAAGVTLVQHMRLAEQNAPAEALIQTDRQLLLIMGVAALLLLLALALVIWYVRRAEDERAQLEHDGKVFFNELKNHVGKLADQLEEERTQFEALLGAMNEGVVYSEGKNIRYANKAVARLTGYSPEEVTKLAQNDGAHPLGEELGQLHEVIRGTIDQGGTWQGEYTITRKDGTEMEIGVVGTPISGANGHTRVLTVLRDNTQNKTFQTQKTRFISNTSHELKTPLSQIRQRLYLLRKQPEKFEEHMTALENVSAYMHQTLNEMLDLARFETGVMLLDRENTIFEDLVSEAVQGYYRKTERRNITLNLSLPPEKHTVFVDQKRMLQVISNLLTNAMNHTPDGGRIDVRVLEAWDAHIAIEVEDNGAGIPPEMLENAFQPFAVASMGEVSGTVLGLSLSKEIVELHDGEITAESEVGQGALYRITLPLLQS